jgi:ribosome maturation factor RimP
MRPDLLKDKVVGLISEPLAAEGAHIADLAVSRYKNQTTVRVYVYSDRGATLDECTRLSHIVGDLLDGTDWLESGYTLEVSSPGLDRPLTTPQDFRYRIGETVKVDFVDSSRKRLEAEIVSANDEDVEFVEGETTTTVKLSDIKKAVIVY